jgi:heme exporter protein B
LKSFWPGLKAIFIKDIVVELRAKQVLPTMVVLGMLIVYILRLVSVSSEGERAFVAAAALWIALLFCGLLAQERSFAAEQANGCMDGLRLAPCDPGTVYLAKLCVNVVMLGIFEAVIVPVVLVAFGLGVGRRWPDLLVILLLGNLGISSVGTLFSAVVQGARTRGSLLSIVVLVVLLPMMIPASFALLVVFGAIPAEVGGSGALAFVGSLRAALGYLIAFDSIFIVACWLLFGLVIED